MVSLMLRADTRVGRVTSLPLTRVNSLRVVCAKNLESLSSLQSLPLEHPFIAASSHYTITPVNSASTSTPFDYKDCDNTATNTLLLRALHTLAPERSMKHATLPSALLQL
jgi:hypothetical protein